MRRFKLTPQLMSLVFIVSSASALPCLGQAGQTPASTTTTTTTNGGSGSPPATSATSGDPKKATDDSNKVEAAVAAASSLVDDANKYQKTIAAITTPATKTTQPALDDMQQLQTAVEAISRSKLFDSLAEKKAGIASAESTRSATSSECAKLSPPDDNSQPDVTKAVAACKKAGSDAKDKTTAIDTAVSGLQSTLGSISPYVASQFVALQDKLKRFSDAKLTGDSPDVSVILDVLPTNLPVLKQVLQNKDQYQSTWNSTKKVLSDLKITAGAKDASGDAAKVPDDEFKNLQAKIDAILPKLDAWFKTVADKMQAEAQSFDNLISGVLGDPAKNSPTALDAVRKQGEDISSAQAIADAWPPLVGFLVDGQPDGLHLKTTKSDLEAMQKWVNVARGAVSRVHDALAGDMSGFETDQVSLYYFTDVQRLMYALNEGFQTMGGVAEAKAQADAQRTALTQTELELADAQATVNRYQKQVLDLQEQQRQAQAKLKGLSSNVSKLGNRLNNTQDAKNQADADYQQAKSDQAAAPSDPTKTTELNKAAAKQTAAATKLSQSQSDYNAAKSDQDKTQSQVDDSQNQSDSLPAKLAAAQQAMSDAQTAVAAERRKMLLAAQAESDAFAFARDNTPFMVAFADASSSNPAKRVMLYAFNDSKTIFMRGKPDDLALVKRIISKFDTPAPQARLTLWTFELDADSNGKTNEKAAKRLNTSMEIVDEELSNARALENTTLSLLRDVINQEVRVCFGKPDDQKQETHGEEGDKQEIEKSQGQPPNSAKEQKNKPLIAVAQCAPLPVKEKDCFDCTSSDLDKLRRTRFYDPLVLEQLRLKFPKGPEEGHLDVNRLRNLVPDPAGTTTLGEALMIVSLAPLHTRLAVRDNFERAIQDRLRRLPLSKNISRCAWYRRDKDKPYRRDDKKCTDYPFVSDKKPCDGGECLLPLTWNRLAIWEQGVKGSGSGLTSQQLEITRALNTAYNGKQFEQLLNKLTALYQDIGTSSQKLSELQPEQKKYEDAAQANLQKNSPGDAQRLVALEGLSRPLSESETAEKNTLMAGAIGQLPTKDQGAHATIREATSQLTTRLRIVKLRSAQILNQLEGLGLDFDSTEWASKLGAARVMGDDAVKKTLLDLKISLYQTPTLSSASPRVAAADEMLKEIIIALEDDLDRLFVQPMIENLRIRLLATKVRVGILQRESLLASNRGKARIDPKASAQLAVGEEQDILSGVQQLAQLYSTVQSGGALAAFGALQQQPREQQPEIYALTTGNKFEVTPIFDPSGQALRFKFDFVSTTNLQEPNGTTNPQFPRIERHTVNTEVQLTNLETREISRFESDARLGLPTTYWGGLPILKDIPGIRPWIPLVGWFVRKGGSNASAQQSVIFGQTTMYPTIGNIIDLLADNEGIEVKGKEKSKGTEANKEEADKSSPNDGTGEKPR